MLSDFGESKKSINIQKYTYALCHLRILQEILLNIESHSIHKMRINKTRHR